MPLCPLAYASLANVEYKRGSFESLALANVLKMKKHQIETDTDFCDVLNHRTQK